MKKNKKIKYLSITLFFLLLSGALLGLSGLFSRCEYKYYECMNAQCMVVYNGITLFMNQSEKVYLLDRPCRQVGLFDNVLFILGVMSLAISFYPIFRIIEIKEVE